MDRAQNPKSTGKIVVILILVAVVTAVAVTLIQRLLIGESSVAVTGGAVGAVTAIIAINTIRKK